MHLLRTGSSRLGQRLSPGHPEHRKPAEFYREDRCVEASTRPAEPAPDSAAPPEPFRARNSPRAVAGLLTGLGKERSVHLATGNWCSGP